MKNKVMIGLSYACLLIALAPLVAILIETTAQGAMFIDVAFLTQLPPAVGEPGGGIGNAIQGTIILIAVASLIGVPIGVVSGIFLAEYRESKLAAVVRFFNDVLTEFPSIVIGIFAYTLIVLYAKGFSAFAGAFALSIIMIPVVTRTTEESIKIVPASIREAAIALGVSRWKTTMKVVLSTARAGVVTGIMLSVARASGETAPLLLTAFNSFFWFSGLDKPVASLPMYIFIFAISPFADWRAKAWGAALILILLVLMVNVIVRLLTRGKYR